MRDDACRRGNEDAPSTSMVKTSIVRRVVPVGRWGERLAKWPRTRQKRRLVRRRRQRQREDDADVEPDTQAGQAAQAG